MASTIKLKNGSGAPTTGDLVQGEPALDLTNKRLYTENASGVVIEVGTNPSTIDINAGTIDGTVIGGTTAAAITGTTITGTSFVSSGDMTFEDNDKAVFGDGSDLRIYHTGSHSTIENIGTGHLQIHTTDFRLRNSAGTESMILANADGNVQLFYDNAEKLATTATGIDVTGTVTADGLSLDNAQYINFKNSSNVSTRSLGINVANTFYIGGIDADIGDILFVDGGATRASFANGGDISFYEDTGTTAKLFWDASEERLGIGTTSPSVDLDVEGTAQVNLLEVTHDADRAVNFVKTGANTFSIEHDVNQFYFWNQTTSESPLLFQNDGDVIMNGGNVGIGTSSPAYKLDIRATSTPTIRVLETTNGPDGRFLASASDVQIGTYGGSPLSFYTNSTEKMRIDTSGNVGIGAGSPTTSLTLGTGTTGVSFQSGSLALNSGKIAVIKPIEVGTGNGHLVFETYEGGSGGGERMRIDSTGNVGIGDSSPSVKLDVYQSTVGVGVVDFRHVNGNRILINPSYNYYDAYNHIFRGLNGTDTHMTIDDSGNVGIGTGSPTSGGGLTLSSSTTAQSFIDFKHTVDGDSGFIGNAKALVTGGTTNQLGVRGGTSGIAFSVGAAEAARIDSAGNVGIGVSPSQKLHVAGNIVLDAAGFVGFGGGTNYIEGSATNLLKFGTANVERMRIDSSGRVTMPYQPAFNVNPLSDQNNIAINTPVTVIFNTEVFDVGSNFASNTFTAPVTGKYQLNLALRLHNIDTAADFYQIKFLTSNRSYLSTADYGVLSSNPNYWTEAFSVLADMDANDTVSITVSQSGGSVQTDIHVETTFSGYLVA
jgi:hypothetical protein